MIRRPPRSTLDRSSAASDVYKRQPQHHPTHPGHLVITNLDVHRSRPSAGPADQFAGIKQRACSVHPTGAPVSGRIGQFVLPILPANRGTCRVKPHSTFYPAAISGSEVAVSNAIDRLPSLTISGFGSEDLADARMHPLWADGRTDEKTGSAPSVLRVNMFRCLRT